MKVNGRKTETPAWVDKLLSFRKEITEDEYTQYWRRLNKIRKNREEWNSEGQRIIRELEGEKERAIFHSHDFRSTSQAKRAAEIYKSDHPGSRIIRRDSRGRFNPRGRTFQVVQPKERTLLRDRKGRFKKRGRK